MLSTRSKFSSSHARRVIQDVLEETFTDESGAAADVIRRGLLTMEAADVIRGRLKQREGSRYKLVVFVSVCEEDRTSLCFVSRSLWNDQLDTYADYTHRGGGVYAVGVVHAIYTE